MNIGNYDRINFKAEREPKTAKQLALYESQKTVQNATMIVVNGRGNRASKRMTGAPRGPARFTMRKFRRVIEVRRIEALQRAAAEARRHEKVDAFTVTKQARQLGKTGLMTAKARSLGAS